MGKGRLVTEVRMTYSGIARSQADLKGSCGEGVENLTGEAPHTYLTTLKMTQRVLRGLATDGP